MSCELSKLVADVAQEPSWIMEQGIIWRRVQGTVSMSILLFMKTKGPM